MIDQDSAEHVKKVVGKKKRSDVWSDLYRLNIFAANLGLRAENDGYPPKKIVGNPRSIASLPKRAVGEP